MIYDKSTRSYGDGQWHCPFSEEWVKRMAKAAKCCRMLSPSQIKAAYKRIDNGWYYVIPPGNFLSEPQDSRGLPLSYHHDYHSVGSCCDIYDYHSIPEIVITNGSDDWPFRQSRLTLTA